MKIHTLYAFVAAAMTSAVVANVVPNLQSESSLSRKKRKKHQDDPNNGKGTESIIGATVTIGHLVHDPSAKGKEEDAVADAFRKAYNKVHLEDNHQLEEAVVERSIFFPEDDDAAMKSSWSFWPKIVTPRWATNDGSIFDIIAKGNMQRLSSAKLPTQFPPETHEMHKLLEAEVCKNVRESEVDAMKEAMHCQVLYTYAAVDEASSHGSSEPENEETMVDNAVLQEQVSGKMGVVFRMHRFLRDKESTDLTHHDLIENTVIDAYNELRDGGGCYLTAATVQRAMEVPSDESKEAKHGEFNRPSLFVMIDSFRALSPFDAMYWLSVEFSCNNLEESYNLQASLLENLALVDSSVHRSFESHLCDKINMGAQDCSVSYSLDIVIDTE